MNDDTSIESNTGLTAPELTPQPFLEMKGSASLPLSFDTIPGLSKIVFGGEEHGCRQYLRPGKLLNGPL